MPAEVLLLALEGALQSWGVRAHWDSRDSASAPTKSGLVGLISCALGYPRGDQRIVELGNSIRVGVRADREGSRMRDYHTVTEYLPTAAGAYKHSGIATGKDLERLRATGAAQATIVSTREYIADACFLAAIESRGDDERFAVSTLAAALRAPHWPLFLGRRSCVPSRPVVLEVSTQYSTLIEAVERYPLLRRIGSRVEPRDGVRAIVEADSTTGRAENEVLVSSRERYYERRFSREIVVHPGLPS